MNILTKQETEKDQLKQHDTKLTSLSYKVIKYAHSKISSTLFQSLQEDYENLVQKCGNPFKFIQKTIYCLLAQISAFSSVSQLNFVNSYRSNRIETNRQINNQDYLALQQAMQRSEAQIRKHIRIEQQLKIYLDSLQEKIQEYQKKLEREAEKYNQLYQTIREMTDQRHKLIRKINTLQTKQEKPKINYSAQNSTKQFLEARKARNSKTKIGIQRGRNKQQKAFAQGAIHINLSNNIVLKKGSYDHSKLHKGQNPSYDASVRQLTKTLQMYQPQKRPIRKLSKYRTQVQTNQKKQFRSNSVCH